MTPSPASTSERPPYGSYAVLLGSFAGALAATAGLERSLGRHVRPETPLDLALLAGATFKAARALSRERIGSVVREPLVETNADAPGEPPREVPTGKGFRRALGELVTCTRCTGTWAAAGIIASQTVAPRFGRILTWTLAAGAANDFLQAGFAALCERSGADTAHPAADAVRPG